MTAIAAGMEENHNAAGADNSIHLIISILHSQSRRYRLVDNVVHFRNLRQVVPRVLYALRHGQHNPAILGETQSTVAALAPGLYAEYLQRLNSARPLHFSMLFETAEMAHSLREEVFQAHGGQVTGCEPTTTTRARKIPFQGNVARRLKYIASYDV